MEEAKRLEEQLKNNFGLANVLNTTANIYEAKGDFDAALGYHGQAKKIREQINDVNGVASSSQYRCCLLKKGVLCSWL